MQTLIVGVNAEDEEDLFFLLLFLSSCILGTDQEDAEL